MDDRTCLFDIAEVKDTIIADVLREVISALEERGYNATNQIVGYIISGDPGYISAYKDARKKITSIDRTVLVELLLRKYLAEIK